MSDVRMPKVSTIRRHINSTLSDEEILKITEWTTEYTGRQFIKPNNIILKALISYTEKLKEEK